MGAVLRDPQNEVDPLFGVILTGRQGLHDGTVFTQLLANVQVRTSAGGGRPRILACRSL